MAGGRKGGRRRRGGPPARGGEDGAEGGGGVERCIGRLAAEGVIDDVEAPPAGIFGYVVFDRYLPIVDRHSAELLDKSLACGRAGRKSLSAESARDLDRDVPDAAGTAMDQDFLARAQGGAIDQPFPGGDANQLQPRRFTP